MWDLCLWSYHVILPFLRIPLHILYKVELSKQVEDPHEARAAPPAGGYSPDRGLCLRGLGG